MPSGLEWELQAIVAHLDPSAREYAEEQIGAVWSAGGTSFGKLLTLVFDAERPPEVRAAACWVLGRLGNADAVPTLIVGLADDNAEVRAGAAEALGELGDLRALHPLIHCFEGDGDPEVREAAGEALGQMKSPEAVRALARMLKDRSKHPDDRSRAAESLGDLALKRFSAVPEAIPALVGALEDEEACIRHDSAIALGYIQDTRAAGSLICLLEGDPEPSVREAAAGALWWIGSTEAIEPLVRVLARTDEEPAVRGRAANALGHLPDGRALRALLSALDDPSAEIRYWSALALGEMGDGRAIPKLESLTDDDATVEPWGQVGDAARQALSKILGRTELSL